MKPKWTAKSGSVRTESSRGSNYKKLRIVEESPEIVLGWRKLKGNDVWLMARYCSGGRNSWRVVTRPEKKNIYGDVWAGPPVYCSVHAYTNTSVNSRAYAHGRCIFVGAMLMVGGGLTENDERRTDGKGWKTIAPAVYVLNSHLYRCAHIGSYTRHERER